MEELNTTNLVTLRGSICEPPVFSHEIRGERFDSLSLEVRRLSGATDTIHIIVRESQLALLEPDGEEKLWLSGELRSFNNKSGVGPRLIISVFPHRMRLEDGPDENTVELSGTLCKDPVYRVTPMGREICDLMLAVRRRYGRSDYLPCIAWGSCARQASHWEIGTQVSLTGRIQSRIYSKVVNGETQEKTAYEVSIITLREE